MANLKYIDAMMFLKQALQALGIAAQHPLAVGLYILVVASWLVISLRVKRHRALLNQLKTLPEKDRLKALELEIGPLPKKGIDAEQWLRAREQVFKLARIGIFSVTAIIILSLAVFYFMQLQASAKALSVSGRVTLDGKPSGNAQISLVGVEGQWFTDLNGGFNFEIVDMTTSDSITLAIACSTNYRTVSLDTTLSKTALTAIQLHLRAPSLCIFAGQVIEIGTGNPVPGAQIILDDNRGIGVTDSLGFFHFIARGRPYESIRATVVKNGKVGFSGGVTLSEENRIPFRRQP